MNEVSLDQLSAEQFAELVGTTFTVVTPATVPSGLELTTVTPARPSGNDYENFCLLFDGSAEHPLPQRTHQFEHQQIGRFDLFIVPVGNEHGRRQYQAVFNRLRKKI